MPSATKQLFLAANAEPSQLLLFSIEIFGGLSLAPAFWLYVVMLTKETPTLPKRLYVHFLLPAASMLLLPINPIWPDHIDGVLTIESLEGVDAWSLAYGILAGIFSLAMFPQLAVYIWLAIRRLINYRLRLKDIYASTEEYELNWIVTIGLLAVLFWLAQFIGLVSLSTTPPNFVLSDIYHAVSIILFVVMTVWGLRTQPGLMPNSSGWSEADVTNPKYDKSALSNQDALRIEKKLRLAMGQQRLYRDPGLSLWKLSQHTGASPNYISQTLNEVIGQNFFDFVNTYRIDEAKAQLENADETIINIAYDVGFNSRSSFYTAFKKEVGKTPSSYRKNVRMR